jgi:hypothetical protein
MDAPDPSLQQRVTRLIHKRSVSWRRAHGGYTPAQRWIVSFEDGTSCFAKSAAGTPVSPMDQWLRREYDVYSRLEAAFLPRMLAWEDDGIAPLLILEDLSAARWPPPWQPRDVEAVLETLAVVRAAPLDVTLAEDVVLELRDRWRQVQADPSEFLSLGLCSERWLEAALPALIEAEGSTVLDGDNLLLVDWNHAGRGNGQVDVAFFLPSLHSEGGPLPEATLPDAPEWAALISGFFAARAGAPPIPNAPRVREVQLSQLRSALPWAVRTLGLPPLDGPNAPGD